MKAELPKFPDLPWSSIEASTFLPLRFDDLDSRADVEELIRRMFNEPETAYYLYTRVGQPAPSAVIHSEKRGEILISLVKRPFYLHRGGSDHSFTQIEEASLDGVEYQQMTLRLSERITRELSIKQHVATVEAMKSAEPIIQVKPAWFGIGVDLRALWRRVFGKSK